MSRRPWQRTFRPGLEMLEALDLPSGITLVPTYVLGGHPLASHQSGSGAPSGLSPAQVRAAYGIDQISFKNGSVAGNGAGETIAIVDAYDDPSIANDLHQFDSTFGMPDPTFTKVNETGGTSLPSPNSGWAGEIELDVEWAHAVAPGASILLVEANSASDTDLIAAVNYARQQPGVVTVSMSWGSTEFSGEQSYDSTFTTPTGHAGVTFFGSSGDSGSPAIWPALSTHVVAVGGTSLTLGATGAYQGETGWSGSGGGISQYETAPGYQQGLTIDNGSGTVAANGHRAGPDVSYDADPTTAFAVYGTYGWGGWAEVGGTSAAAPQWAALVAIADQGRAASGLASLDGYTQTLPDLYQLPASDFHDLTSGSNGGYSAGAGYDLVTGRGSPIANLVVAGLVGGSTGGSTSKPPTVATAAHVVSQSPTSAALAVLGADAAGASSLTYAWKVIAGTSSAVSFSANGSNAASGTTATFTALGTYTLQVTITDASGLSVTNSVSVTVSPVATSIRLTPGTTTVAPKGTQQFSAVVLDQFGNALASQPKVTWSATGTGGTVGSTGLFTAGASAGSAVVKAAVGNVSATVSVSVAASTVVFSDNFTSGAGQWTVTSGYGDYYLANVNGNNRLMVENNGWDVSRIVAGQSSWSNYSYQATLNLAAISTGSASLLARVQDTNHLYFFGYNVALGKWMIALDNGGTVTILATSATFALQAGQDYTVRADLSGSSLKLYVGGVLEVSTTDSTFASGKIGFSATNALAYLDNVTVTTLPGSTAATAASAAAKPAAAASSYDALFAALYNQARSWGGWIW
jgi:subtilase family serine protease